ncbi:MAG TPA: glycosyltransferase [Segeticoccus sp.]|jgi:putative flippase GtrA|nr:glycosyltransferase [Segeticoccus sp.]
MENEGQSGAASALWQSDEQQESTVDQCVVVPTRNEAHNVEPLVAQLEAAFRGSRTLVIVVDDSDDSTPAVVREVASRAELPLKLVHRPPGERSGGLGSAVLAGLHLAVAAGAPWAVVMDGDLQHPPEVAPELLARGRAETADVVVATRYVGDGSAAGLAAPSRAMASAGAVRLSKAVFPRRLRDCTDPMSGFFAVRLGALDLNRLHPQGFKILLEIVARHRGLAVSEHPFTFAERHSGESKACWREGALFAHRLASLRIASAGQSRGLQHLTGLVGFAAVGASGMVVNTVLLWVSVHALAIGLFAAAVLATQVSIAWNFIWTDTLVFDRPKSRPLWRRVVEFGALNNGVLLVRLPLLAWLVHHVDVHYLAANVATLFGAFLVRFVVCDLFVFARSGGDDIAAAEAGISPEQTRPHHLLTELASPTDS